MKTILLSFVAGMALFGAACSKQADSETAPGSNKAAETKPLLRVGDEQLSVTQKSAPEQGGSIHSTMPGEGVKTMAPQPLLIKGQADGAQLLSGAAAVQTKVKPVPSGRVTFTQTPAARAQVHTQAMEELLRARKQDKAAAGKK